MHHNNQRENKLAEIYNGQLTILKKPINKFRNVIILKENYPDVCPPILSSHQEVSVQIKSRKVDNSSTKNSSLHSIT